MAFLTDNFNSYNNGDLNGQGGWSGDAKYDVQGDTVNEGTKAIEIADSSNSIIAITATSTANGKITVFVRKTTVASDEIVFKVRVGAGEGFAFRFESDDVDLSDSSGNFTVEVVSGLSADTWHIIEAEWTSGTPYQARVRVNGGSWSSLTNCRANGPYNNLRIATTIGASDFCYFDNISENPLFAISAAVGTFALTGISVNWAIKMATAVGTFILTGITTTLTKVTPWDFRSKNTTSWTYKNKS